MFIYRIVAHIDASIIHKLSRLCPSLLTLIASSLDVDLASSMASSTRYIFLGSHAPSPHPSARIKYEVLGDSGVQDKPLMQEGGLEYDSDNNQLTTYAVDVNDGSAHIFKRSFMFNRLDDSESQIGLAKAMNVSDYTGEDDLFVVYESDSHVVSHPQGNKDQVVLFARDEKKGWTHHLMETVEHAWQAIVVMFRKVGISIRHLLERIASKIPWDDISHTTAFLSLFYRKLGTLSLNGFDMARSLFRGTLRNITSNTDNMFENVIDNLGEKNITWSSLMKDSKNFGNSTSEPSVDANTAMVHDRVINNIQHITIDYSNKGVLERLFKICSEAGSSVKDAFDINELKQLRMDRIGYPRYNSLLKSTMGMGLSFLRNLLVTFEHVASNLFASIMQFVPLYWNLALEFMNLPLKVPYLYDFWTMNVGYAL